MNLQTLEGFRVSEKYTISEVCSFHMMRKPYSKWSSNFFENQRIFRLCVCRSRPVACMAYFRDLLNSNRLFDMSMPYNHFYNMQESNHGDNITKSYLTLQAVIGAVLEHFSQQVQYGIICFILLGCVVLYFLHLHLHARYLTHHGTSCLL